jgi:hypothetical protein
MILKCHLRWSASNEDYTREEGCKILANVTFQMVIFILANSKMTCSMVKDFCSILMNKNGSLVFLKEKNSRRWLILTSDKMTYTNLIRSNHAWGKFMSITQRIGCVMILKFYSGNLFSRESEKHLQRRWLMLLSKSRKCWEKSSKGWSRFKIISAINRRAKTSIDWWRNRWLRIE